MIPFSDTEKRWVLEKLGYELRSQVEEGSRLDILMTIQRMLEVAESLPTE